MAERLIFHCDGNNFFASCECIDHPEWRNVPMAVAGNPKDRAGIVVAKNDLAKKAGVQTTDTVWQARNKCPEIVFAAPRHALYADVSRRVNAIYLEYTDRVEPASIDESYLDMTGAPEYFHCTPQELADRLRQRIRDEIGITISVGVSFCKFFAKMGSDYRKPDATTVLTRENYAELLYPLPVGDMLYAGRAAVSTLTRHGIYTIGDLANRTCRELESILGKGGEQLWCYAHGLDESPVRRFDEKTEAKSVSRGTTFRHDLTSMEEVKHGVAVLVDEIASVLRHDQLQGRVVAVTIKRPTLLSVSRQVTLAQPTCLYQEIRDAALQIIQSHWAVSDKSPVRSITIAVTQFAAPDEVVCEQMDLFSLCEPTEAKQKEPTVGREKREKMESAIAGLRQKFGMDAVAQGLYNTQDDIGLLRFTKQDEEQ